MNGNELVWYSIMCIVVTSMFMVISIALVRKIRNSIKHEYDLQQEMREKEIELMQAQIDYYNRKEKEENNVQS